MNEQQRQKALKGEWTPITEQELDSLKEKRPELDPNTEYYVTRTEDLEDLLFMEIDNKLNEVFAQMPRQIFPENRDYMRRAQGDLIAAILTHMYPHALWHMRKNQDGRREVITVTDRERLEEWGITPEEAPAQTDPGIEHPIVGGQPS